MFSLFFFLMANYDISLLFWPSHTAHGILVSSPGIELMSPAVEAQILTILNCFTTRELQGFSLLKRVGVSSSGTVV